TRTMPGGFHGAHARTPQKGEVPGRFPAAPGGERDQRSHPRRKAPHHRRPVRGDARATRRLLPDRRGEPRRGDRHHGTDSGGQEGDRGSAARLRAGGFAQGVMISAGPAQNPSPGPSPKRGGEKILTPLPASGRGRGKGFRRKSRIGAPIMRYLMMIKYNENGTPPPQSLFDALAKNRLEAKQAGVLLECNGLQPSATG